MENETRTNLKALLVATAYIFAIMLVVTIVGWLKIPDGQRIVTHSNLRGQPDAYTTNKAFALLGLPIATLILAGVFALLARIENLSSVKTIMWAAGLTPFVVLQGITVWTAMGRQLDASAVMWGTSGLLFIVIGNYFPKLRQNRFSGIKTPWTLSSELSWSKTHRIGGKLFMLYGLVVLISALLLDASTMFGVIIAGMLALVLFLTIYSYTVWKSDPDR